MSGRTAGPPIVGPVIRIMPTVARLSAAERARLPDRAYAYVDSHGNRRLPIVDAAHVRNALARFNQVEFEDERAREQALLRLLRAAKRFRIVPVGFISSQLRSEREAGAAWSAADLPLPTGFVTMLMTDIEGSTALVRQLGDDYQELLTGVRDIQRRAATEVGGCVVETRADEFFAAFASPRAALEAAVTAHRGLADRRWRDGLGVRIRSGVHAGYPTMVDANYIGLAVHTTARVCAVAHGGQIVVSGDMKTALTGMAPEGVRFRTLGTHRLRGIPDEVPLFQVLAAGLPSRFPAPRV